MSASTFAVSSPDGTDAVTALAGASPAPASVPALQMRGLIKALDRKIAVDRLSLDIPVSSFYGIVGPNGAGKTTFMECLEGLRRPTSGTIDVLGEDPSRPSTRWRERIGVQLQTAALPPKITVNEAMALFASMYSDPADPAQLLNELGIAAKGRSYVDKLSGGQRQALTLLMATVVTPKLLLLDEHTAALDPQTAAKVLALTARIVRDRNISCLMVTHNMHQALELGNRTLMMDSGRIVFDVSGEERAAMTVQDLLDRFKQGAGSELNNDRILLSE